MSDKCDNSQQTLSEVYDIFQRYSTLHVPERSMYSRLKRIDRICGGTLNLGGAYEGTNYYTWDADIKAFLASLCREFEQNIVQETPGDTYKIEIVLEKLYIEYDSFVSLLIKLYYKRL